MTPVSPPSAANAIPDTSMTVKPARIRTIFFMSSFSFQEIQRAIGNISHKTNTKYRQPFRPKRIVANSKMKSVVVGHGHRNVHGTEQREHEGLHEANE